MKKQKKTKKYVNQQRFDEFLSHFLRIISNENGRARSKKIVKTLVEIFREIEFLTEKIINYDVTSSVILSTVR